MNAFTAGRASRAVGTTKSNCSSRSGMKPSPASRATVSIATPQSARAWATAAKVWPQLDVICSSRPLALDDYIASIGDVDQVINMLVGDTQRITVYAEKGFAVHQEVPPPVEAACQRLVTAGYTGRLF